MKAKMLMQMYCVGPMMKEPRKRRQDDSNSEEFPRVHEIFSVYLQDAIFDLNIAALPKRYLHIYKIHSVGFR